MAHSLSAKKRVRQNAKRRTINRTRRSKVKAAVKSFETALAAGDVQAATEQFKAAVRMLDKVSCTSTMHKKTAARKKSRLARRLNALKAGKGGKTE